ncbi:hypothetical protein GCM10028806_05420 [Spirosoma terrae]
MMSLSITIFYIAPLLIVLAYGMLAQTQDEIMPIAVGIALLPVLNFLAAMRCIYITVRVTVDWLAKL